MNKNRYEKFFENHISVYKDRKIFDTNHSLDRFNDKSRFNIKAGEVHFKNRVIKAVQDAIDLIIVKYNDYPANYIVHSKSTGIGVVVDWRFDMQDRTDNTNHAFIVSLLPIKKQHFKKYPTDVELIVEKQLKEWATIQLKKEKRKILKEESAYDRVSSRDSLFSVLFWEGEYYDATFYQIIVVD